MNNLTYFVDGWCAFLRGAETVLGLPIALLGAALMLMGWRIWPAVACGCLALLGGLGGQIASQQLSFQPVWVGGGIAVTCGLGLLFRSHTPTLVGALVGGGVVTFLLERLAFEGFLLWGGAALGMIATGAWAFAYKHQVVVVVSAFFGGALAASGIAILLPAIPLLQGFFRSMTATSPFMIVFFVLVPTVVGITLQYADSNRSSSKAVRS